jgi:[acyl-carrier-protein] S-malonyltransferase
MFAGQGAQFVGMGADLARESVAARAVFERADRVLGLPLSGICADGPLERLTESAVCQPAIYTMSMACVAALRERVALEPLACGGLSLGEFAAVTVAGVLDFDACLPLVAARGRYMGEACRADNGGMAAVLKAQPELVRRVAAEHGVDVANENCPGQIVISGAVAALEQAMAALKAEGVSTVVPLQVDGAFHSRLMAPAAERFAADLAGVSVSRPQCSLVQNVAGATVSDPGAIRANLAAQITGTVRWEACVRAMLQEGVEVLVELGPGNVLSGFMRRIDRGVPVCRAGTLEELNAAVELLGG